MILLTHLTGRQAGTQARFTQPLVRLGRAPNCDVRFDDEEGREVSGHHAEIVRDEGGWVLLDTASTNGTWVGGERIGKRRLASGEVVHLGGDGGVELRVELLPDEERPPVAGRTPAPTVARQPGTPAPSAAGADGTEAEATAAPAPARKVPGVRPLKRGAGRSPAGKEARAGAADEDEREILAHAADVARHKVEVERAKAGGKSSGQTIAIMAAAMADVQQATKVKAGRRWKKVVAAVAGAGLVAAAVMGVVIYEQRREIQRLVALKTSLDKEIAAVQEAMEREGDAARLEELEGRLTQLTGNAQSTLGALARQDRAAARQLEEGGDDLDRAIRRILVKFDARTYAVPPVFRDAVQREIAALERSGNLRAVWARRNRWWPVIQREFSALGLPEEMAYVAWVETQFDPSLTSSAGARGMWQMMAPTARSLGLRVDDQVDERLDVPRQTRAAARHLANLLAEFGADSFMLAMASYNRGAHGVRRVLHDIAREKDGFRREKRDFWHLYRLKRLPQETRDYVPRVLAAAVVGSEPQRHGLAGP
jgi:soluble lytic murein transglycosylase-like protein